MDAVTPGPRADAEENVAHSFGAGPDQVALAEEADAHRVDQRVARIAGGEADFAAEGRDADAIAVVADSAHDAGEEIAVARHVERTEAETVEHRDRSRAHREDVAQDPADAGGSALIRFDRRRVIVRLHL